jgi:hypothetical protein
MNVREIVPINNSTDKIPMPYKLVHYVAVAVSFTLASIWIIITFQSKHFLGENTSFWKRLVWPYMFFVKFLNDKTEEQDLDTY